MKKGGQTHDTIDVRLRGAKIRTTASRNGNNAAWLCVCGYRLPLIWSGWTKKTPTVCPECGRCYMAGLRGKSRKPVEITEMLCEKK